MSLIKKSIEAAFAFVATGKPPGASGGESIRAGHRSEFTEGACKIIQHERLSIGVYLVGGAFHAIRNYCPHQGAPLCLGTLHSTHEPSAVGEFRPALPGRVLRCPWHGWEFDLATGKGLYDAKGRVRTYATRVDAAGDVFVEL